MRDRRNHFKIQLTAQRGIAMLMGTTVAGVRLRLADVSSLVIMVGISTCVCASGVHVRGADAATPAGHGTAATATVTVDGGVLAATTSDHFTCWNIDASTNRGFFVRVNSVCGLAADPPWRCQAPR